MDRPVTERTEREEARRPLVDPHVQAAMLQVRPAPGYALAKKYTIKIDGETK